MKVIDTYIVNHYNWALRLYFCENGKWFWTKPVGNVGYQTFLVEIEEEKALDMIEKERNRDQEEASKKFSRFK